ncbi:VOC family protein [Actinomadura fibrosa]|uniref:VOC family protein n=1 Tax=Actinomadura fibrosa TaxID=111802 RepID=A0ABW2XND3_9ACTN|nr:VOC family protein [Actinomadura fibrosa]
MTSRQTTGSVVAVSHIGLCVSDFGRSLRSYTEGLGFTHLSVYVDDLRAVEERLLKLGATAIESMRSHIPMRDGAMDVLFLADPDGVRIELIQHTR